MYVFVQSGHAINNTVSSSALQTTDSYNTTGLTGTESYVWTLETATDGFYMKNVSITSYINNASGTNMSFGNKSSIWAFAFTDGVALISNKSNANRFLGYTNATSYAYKAYASSNLSSYAHDITVYKLVEESTPTCIAPTFSPVAGTYTSAQNVTISTTTSGATIYYTTNGTNPTTSSSVYSTPIAISENTTIKAMAVKSGYNNSPIATAEYTIELPLSTMQAIFDRATAVGTTATSVNIALQNWVVSGVSTNGKNVFVTDGSKGFVIFNSSGDLGVAVGNVLSGTVSCNRWHCNSCRN